MSSTQTAIDTTKERLRRLGDAWRRADELEQDAREARDQAIEQADLEGLSVRQIAAAVGLSRPRVHQVLVDRTAARQAHLTRPT